MNLNGWNQKVQKEEILILELTATSSLKEPVMENREL